MSMTRMHFEALALALKESKPEATDISNSRARAILQWRADVRAIASVLIAHNPRFDTRFYAACGYETTEGVEK